MTVPDGKQIEIWIIERLAHRLRLSPDEIDANESPLRYGADSLTLFTIAGDLEVRLGRTLEPDLLWEYPTIASLAIALAEGPSGKSLNPPLEGRA